MPIIMDPLQERSAKKADYLDEVVFALGGYVSPEELADAINGFESDEAADAMAETILSRREAHPAARKIVDFRHLHSQILSPG